MLDSVTLYKMQAETILIQLQSVYKESEIRQPRCVDDTDNEKDTDCDEKETELCIICRETVRQIKSITRSRDKNRSKAELYNISPFLAWSNTKPMMKLVSLNWQRKKELWMINNVSAAVNSVAALGLRQRH